MEPLVRRAPGALVTDFRTLESGFSRICAVSPWPRRVCQAATTTLAPAWAFPSWGSPVERTPSQRRGCLRLCPHRHIVQ